MSISFIIFFFFFFFFFQLLIGLETFFILPSDCPASRFFLFCFLHTQNTTKQNNRHILNISRSNQKGGREGRTIRTQKVTPLYNHLYPPKTLPSINGRRPGPTDSRRCTFTHHYLQEAMDPICFSTRVV